MYLGWICEICITSTYRSINSFRIVAPSKKTSELVIRVKSFVVEEGDSVMHAV